MLPPVVPPSAPPSAPIRFFAGTSGWAYPTWRPGFYPAQVSPKNFLRFYASQLNSIEINHTFRTLPSTATVAGWVAETGKGFRFSFKAPQRMTHFSRLLACESHLEAFLGAIEPARAAKKLGLILFQLPPNFKLHLDRLQNFLAIPLLKQFDAPLAFEFRHPDWFCKETYAILTQHNAALCIADTDDLQTPEVHTAALHTCFRLRRHGGYTAEELAALSECLLALSRRRTVYAYFRHEDEPTGALNATSFLAAAVQKARENGA